MVLAATYMAPFFTYVLVLGFSLYGLILIIEAIRYRRLRRVAAQAASLFAVAVLLHFATGFPAPDSRQAFGEGFSPITAVGIMLVSTLLGIAARYFFYMRDFSWRSFLKPLCITPIILLPLIGSVQSNALIEEIQLISFAFLAFQNGFFWKMVLEQTKPVVLESNKKEA